MPRRTQAPDLQARLRAELKKAADPDRAKGMQAYMKSEMPYYGVASPILRGILRELFKDHPLETAEDWRRDVLALWEGAARREERYAAIELTGVKRAKAFQTMDALPMYEQMIVEGAWWDYVDVLASHRLGALLENHPREMKKKMLAWSKDANMWKRRSSILCQLRFKEETDLELLYACIEPSLDSKEFFLRKAIGWALRQYAWTDPKEVKRYVKAYEDRLSGLSKREALKNAAKMA